MKRDWSELALFFICGFALGIAFALELVQRFGQ